MSLNANKIKTMPATLSMPLAAFALICFAGFSFSQGQPQPELPPPSESPAEVPTAAVKPVMSAAEAEKMFPDGLTFDFGAVPRRTRALHWFPVVNTSNSPLEITSVTSVSGGAHAYLGSSPFLAPGARGSVAVFLDSREFRGPKLMTHLVTLDNGKTGKVKLTVRADSRDDVSLSEDLHFGTIKPGETATMHINVTFSGHPKLQVTDLKCMGKFVQVKLRELTRNATETVYQLHTTVSADQQFMAYYYNLQLFTNDPEIPSVLVPLQFDTLPAPK